MENTVAIMNTTNFVVQSYEVPLPYPINLIN